MKTVFALLVILGMAAASPTQILRRKNGAAPQDFALLAQVCLKGHAWLTMCSVCSVYSEHERLC